MVVVRVSGAGRKHRSVGAELWVAAARREPRGGPRCVDDGHGWQQPLALAQAPFLMRNSNAALIE